MKLVSKFKPLIQSTHRYKVNKGGAGSSKSYSTHQVEIIKALQNVECVMFVRKVANTLKNSCFKLIKEILSNEGWIAGKHYKVNKTDKSFEFPNGSTFIMVGMDDPEKIKSIAGVTRILIEEGSQLTFEDFTQIDLRIRGIDIKHPSITINFNPIDIDHWLKSRFFDIDSEDILIIESDYRDNPFLDESYKKMLFNLKDIDPLYYDIYVLNKWGTPKTDFTFAYEFDESKHVFDDEEVEVIEGYDLLLWYDFNISNTVLIIQEIDNQIRICDSFHLKNGIEELCARLLVKYPDYYYIVGGDSSGNHRNAMVEGNVTNYEVIKSVMDLSNRQFQVQSANPSHKASRTVTNFLFRHFDIRIARNRCKELILDLNRVEVDKRGKLDTFKLANPKRTHWLDPLRYYFHVRHLDKLREKVGDERLRKILNQAE